MNRKHSENSIENESQITFPQHICIEGVGGSGKSHLLEFISGYLSDNGIFVVNHKVSGMGESQRVQRLKDINEYRQSLIDNGSATENILEDKKKDRVFRLATRVQIKDIINDLETTNYMLAIFDRSPIMPWVYSSSADKDNPYLEEIFQDCVNQFKNLNINNVILLDVSPVTSYSRILSRMIKNKSEAEVKPIIELAQNLMKVDNAFMREVLSKALSLVDSFPDLIPKQFARWDFIPYNVMLQEGIQYKIGLERIKNEIGVNYRIINAEENFQEVSATLVNTVNGLIKQP